MGGHNAKPLDKSCDERENGGEQALCVETNGINQLGCMVGADVHTVAIALLVTVMFAALERFRADNPKYQSKSHPILAAADMLSSRDPVESPDAKSQSSDITHLLTALQALNQHSAAPYGYEVGVAHDRGQRRTMEDAYSFIVDFGNVRGQGYFAIFDGHAGKHAAEWCGQNFHKLFLGNLAEHNEPIPDILNRTFHAVDKELSDIAAQGATHSGCTAVTAFLRLEDAEGKPVKGIRTPTDHVAECSTPPTQATHAVSSVGAGKPSGLRMTTRAATSKKPNASSMPVDSSSTIESTASVLPVPVLYTHHDLCRCTRRHTLARRLGHERIRRGESVHDRNRTLGRRRVCHSRLRWGKSILPTPKAQSNPLTRCPQPADKTHTLLFPIYLVSHPSDDHTHDQAAVDIVRKAAPNSAQDAAKTLLEHALSSFSMDNVSVLVVRFLPVGASK
ncbi:PP2C domain-containing protein [Rhizoctonia solani AG-1 IA]|uniref:PP2C domain-containing protein n=1 Tax=Thanatephorus cucumeris (strain AG1-IA) TaxID=983506 RepID=L8WNY6_THACA|nr:PP2C domain-containing protein [Rhizoctonia solani AG-1 IA]